ncbi:MAG: hypothetical protein ACJAZ1_001934 [Yoonia sp.]|jgi:hypothetical protein
MISSSNIDTSAIEWLLRGTGTASNSRLANTGLMVFYTSRFAYKGICL